jgi:hypothetical protein
MKAKVIATDSYENRIQELKEQIRRYEEFIVLHKYFDKVKNLQNSYIVEMRRIVCQKMFEDGWSKAEISKLVCRHHSSVIHLLKLDPNSDIFTIVNENYKQWIENEKYPYSVPETVPSYIHPKGYKTIVSCEIGNINDLK